MLIIIVIIIDVIFVLIGLKMIKTANGLRHPENDGYLQSGTRTPEYLGFRGIMMILCALAMTLLIIFK